MIVLDTHAWVWWIAAPEKLSKRALAAVDHEGELLVPAIACWELAMLVERKRLELDRDVLAWIEQALALPRMTLAAMTPEIAVRAARLGLEHGDPADRLIVATALEHRARLVSKDQTLRSSDLVDVVW